MIAYLLSFQAWNAIAIQCAQYITNYKDLSLAVREKKKPPPEQFAQLEEGQEEHVDGDGARKIKFCKRMTFWILIRVRL
jgi:hypothetical protein